MLLLVLSLELTKLWLSRKPRPARVHFDISAGGARTFGVERLRRSGTWCGRDCVVQKAPGTPSKSGAALGVELGVSRGFDAVRER